MSKKIVHYDNKQDFYIGEIGRSAFVYTVDHPDGERVSNTKLVRTSAIQNRDLTTGEFETRNSLYRPVSKILGKLNGI